MPSSPIRAYLQRHGSTILSPAPEGWKPVPLDDRGIKDAHAGANFLKKFLAAGKGPRPTRMVVSDLVRTQQTAGITAAILGIDDIRTDPDLRAYHGEKEETPTHYEHRNLRGLRHVMAGDGVPLIVAHRSTTAFLDKLYKDPHNWDDWHPDYVNHKLLEEGGVLALSDAKIIPMFRWHKQPAENSDKV